MKNLAIALLLLACANGCTPTSKPNTAPEQTEDVSLTNTYWKLFELNGNPVAPDSTMRSIPHFILGAADNKFHGNTGCNSMSGSYELKDPLGIRLSKIISTRMACMNTMELESGFLRVLEQADNYVITGDTLALNKARMAPLAKFKRELMNNQ
ncbi:MAG: META domain-containing protein [Chitinophagaceae bacterium]|nr:META domain-containing protein [Chitinophagaceae bacterium]